MKIIVTIPAFNEQRNIRKVIQDIPRHLAPRYDVCIVVVDDGSSDDTAQIAEDAGADLVIRHPVNLGVARAFITGITAALKLGADVMVNIDADLQFDPKEIPVLVAPITEGRADVVLGSRFLSEGHRQIPDMKRLGNSIISLLISIISGRRIHDTQCGFRALSRHAAQHLELSGLFTYTQEMVLDMSFKHMRMVEVPVSVRYFRSRKSRVVKSIPKYTFRVLGVILFAVVRQFRGVLAAILVFLTTLQGVLLIVSGV